MKKDKKKTDKSLVVSIIICAVILVSIIMAVLLPEPVTALIQLKKTTHFIDDGNEWTVVVSDPLQSGEEALTNARVVYEGQEGDTVVSQLDELLKNVKYCGNKKINTGIWEMKIVMYSPTDEMKIYIDENGFFLECGGALYEYQIGNKEKESFGIFYERLCSDLKNHE